MAVMVLLANRIYASDVDSSFGITGVAGYSASGDGTGNFVNVQGSLGMNTSWILNYLGLSNSSELAPIDYLGEGANYVEPLDFETTVLVGHQFRNKFSIVYLPISLGLSGSYGVYRGNYIDGTSSNDANPNSYEYYQRKTFYVPGVFMDATPSLLFFRTVSIGLNAYWDVNTHDPSTFGFGLQIGLMANPYKLF